jgi:hypothetical protein
MFNRHERKQIKKNWSLFHINIPFPHSIHAKKKERKSENQSEINGVKKLTAKACADRHVALSRAPPPPP